MEDRSFKFPKTNLAYSTKMKLKAVTPTPEFDIEITPEF